MYVPHNGVTIWFRNWNQIPESELESTPGWLELEYDSESQASVIGVTIGVKNYKLESPAMESWVSRIIQNSAAQH